MSRGEGGRCRRSPVVNVNSALQTLRRFFGLHSFHCTYTSAQRQTANEKRDAKAGENSRLQFAVFALEQTHNRARDHLEPRKFRVERREREHSEKERSPKPAVGHERSDRRINLKM